MLVVNEIRLDTCKCVVEFEHDYDEQNPVDNPELRLHAVLNKCDAHSKVKDEDLLDFIMNENRAKNRMMAHAKEVMGVTIDEIKEKFSFSFDKDRTLSVEIKDITPEQQVQIDQKVANESSEKEKAIIKPVRKG